MNSAHTLKLEEQLCFAIYSTSLQITQCYKPLLTELNLTYPQFLVLMVLWEQDGVNLKSVCARLGQKPGALTPVIKRLESLGYVLRLPNQYDERSIVIELTPAGHGLQFRAEQVRNQVAKAWQTSGNQELIQQLDQLKAVLSNTQS